MMDRLPNCYRCGKQPCACKDGGTLYHGDVLDVLRAMPAGTVQCCVTSPPYFALLVLDPFAGLATVGQTAIHLGHRFIGIDLNSKYLDVAADRISTTPRWRLRQLAHQKKRTNKKPNCLRQEVLF